MKKAIIILLWILIPWGAMIAQDSLSCFTMDTIPIDDDLTHLVDTTDTILHIDAPFILNHMPHVRVYQDSIITQMMYDKRIGYVRGEQKKDGFRVQIYASNRQQEAKREAIELQQRIESQIDLPVYTLSEPPFWKVRIGNFESREEANNYKAIFLHLFPELVGSTYVVPDKIILLQ